MGFVLWHDRERDGYDRCSLLPIVGGTRLTGTAVLPDHGPNATARYILDADDAWCPRRIDVRFSAPAADARAVLLRDATGGWTRDGEPLPELDGCLDVHLPFSPAPLTATLRRLDLPPGGRATVAVAVLTLPDLAVRRAEVTLARDDVTDRVLHTVDGVEHAVLVDPQGLVTAYEDTWIAVALG